MTEKTKAIQPAILHAIACICLVMLLASCPGKQAASMHYLVRFLGLWLVVETALVLFVTRNKSNSESSPQQITELQKQYTLLAKRMERNRVSVELNDSVGHLLAALSIQLDLYQKSLDKDPTRAQQALSTARDLAAQSLTQVRQTLSLMREFEFNLSEALDRLAVQTPGAKIAATELPALPPDRDVELYRLIEDFIITTNNRHAASDLQIELTGNHLVACATVQEETAGLETWLEGIKKRAEKLDWACTSKITPGTEPSQMIELKVTLAK